MFVVFEGIDGSGKTAISNRVAKALRASGLTVQHVREGASSRRPSRRASARSAATSASSACVPTPSSCSISRASSSCSTR